MNVTFNIPLQGTADRAGTVARCGSDGDAQTGDFAALFDELAQADVEEAGVGQTGEQGPRADSTPAADMPEDRQAAADLRFAYSPRDGDQDLPAGSLTTSPLGSADDVPEADTPGDAEVVTLPPARAANRGRRQKDAASDIVEGRGPTESKVADNVAMTIRADAMSVAPSLPTISKPSDTPDAPVTGADAGGDPENRSEARPTRRGDDSGRADTKAAGESMAPASRDVASAPPSSAKATQPGSASPDEAATPVVFVTTSTKAEGDRSTRLDAEAAPLVTVSTLPPAKAKGVRPALPEGTVTVGLAETVQAGWAATAEEGTAASQGLASGEVDEPKLAASKITVSLDTLVAPPESTGQEEGALTSGPAAVVQGDRTPLDRTRFARAQSGFAGANWGREDQVTAFAAPATPTVTISPTAGEPAGTIAPAPTPAEGAPAIGQNDDAETRPEPKPQVAAAETEPADRQTIVRQGPDAVRAERIATANLPSGPDVPEGQQDKTADATAPIMSRHDPDRQQGANDASPNSTRPAAARLGGDPTVATSLSAAAPAASLTTGVAQGIADALGEAQPAAPQPAATVAPDPAATAQAGAVRTIALNLDMREYGQIDVRVSLTGNAIRIHFKAEREETVQALARDDVSLREALHRAGYEAQQIQIDRRDASAPRPSDATGSGQQPANGMGTGASSGHAAGGERTATPEQRSQGPSDADGFVLQDQETHDAPRQDRYRGADRLYV